MESIIAQSKEVSDANHDQHFYEVKQCQKNNWIQKMDGVNRIVYFITYFTSMAAVHSAKEWQSSTICLNASDGVSTLRF